MGPRPRAGLAPRVRGPLDQPPQSARFQRRLAVPRAAPLRSARRGRHDRRGADHPATLRQRRPLRRHAARQPLPAIRGTQSLRQLQGQRHDGRRHPCAHGGGNNGGLRLDRQYERFAGHLRQHHGPVPRRRLCRQWENCLRQAVAGPRLRRADRADPGRLRRRPGPRPRSLQPPQHLPVQQRQPPSPGRAEIDHVPGARITRLAAPRLDRRPRRQPGQLERVRQSVLRIDSTSASSTAFRAWP